jgi:methionyl-tRNA synthetase
LGTVLYHALESLRLIALLLAPFMPATSETMWAQLGLEDYLWKQNFDESGKWGGLKPERKIVKPAPLFPRIDPSKMSSE